MEGKQSILGRVGDFIWRAADKIAEKMQAEDVKREAEMSPVARASDRGAGMGLMLLIFLASAGGAAYFGFTALGILVGAAGPLSVAALLAFCSLVLYRALCRTRERNKADIEAEEEATERAKWAAKFAEEQAAAAEAEGNAARDREEIKEELANLRD